ncbi:MAG: hypothetical protein KME30_28470 [Iphinoe sp. HA4291-MV1]|jgi:hypothetical protein|nr:hypothetical protein [Iphinoe sp. HA4291-MV1]
MAILKTVHLKEFSFISPVIESAEVFRAIETAIPPHTIAPERLRQESE